MAGEHHRLGPADRRPRGSDRKANRRLKQGHADHPYVPLLISAPGIGWVLAFTIAAEIGEIERFSSPEKLTGYTGLCPRVVQSGDSDRRGPLSKHGPRYLRWALLEGTMHALRHPATRSATSETGSGSASSAAPRSPRSTSPAARPRDLAHAFSKPALRSKRRRFSSGGLTALWTCARERTSNFAWSSRRGHRDMSVAPHPEPERRTKELQAVT